MKIISVLSAFIALCSIGYINASDNRVDFQFNDDQNGFVASAQYRNGYMSNGAYANDMREFASRVNQNLNGAVSFTKADRETFNLDSFTNYSLKPNKMGMYEYLSFDGFKCNSNLNDISFSATENYQPSIVLNFDKEDDAHLPNIDAKYIPIMGFEVKNPTGKGMTLRNFRTNGVTGLSYNSPMYIRGCRCNNTNYDFRRLSVLVEDNKGNNDCSQFKGYNGQKAGLGCGLYMNIPGLNLYNGLKVVGLSSSAEKPSGITVITTNDFTLKNISSKITQAGKIAIDMTNEGKVAKTVSS